MQGSLRFHLSPSFVTRLAYEVFSLEKNAVHFSPPSTPDPPEDPPFQNFERREDSIFKWIFVPPIFSSTSMIWSWAKGDSNIIRRDFEHFSPSQIASISIRNNKKIMGKRAFPFFRVFFLSLEHENGHIKMKDKVGFFEVTSLSCRGKKSEGKARKSNWRTEGEIHFSSWLDSSFSHKFSLSC